jgi:photosystem II stability/assembly factor-like uncharacterized protein
MKSLFGMAITSLLALILVDATSAQQVQSMKLLAAQVGWAHSGRHLYWTTDGGVHWKDIAPSQSPKQIIVDVMFLKTEIGWALLSGGDENADEPEFDLASTTNGGKDWLTMPVKIPDLDPRSVTLDGNGTIYFMDADHGWMNLAAVSSAAFRSSSMLMTTDGGKTWAWAPGGSGAGVGSLHFTTAMDGWVAGGPDDQHLYVTHDAAKSWHEVVLKTPQEVPAADVPTYDVPAFSDSKHGSLTVTYSGPDRSASALVMFTTDDAGKTWKPDRSLLKLEETSPGMTVPSTVVGSTLIAAIKSGAKVTLTIVGPGNDVKGIEMDGFRQPPTLSFADASHGWASTTNGLFSTTDGGVSWTEITPTRTRH